jgi:hypothetical protein
MLIATSNRIAMLQSAVLPVRAFPEESPPVNSTKFSAMTTILLGMAAIVLPYLFGTLAVMILGIALISTGTKLWRLAA